MVPKIVIHIKSTYYTLLHVENIYISYINIYSACKNIIYYISRTYYNHMENYQIREN